MAMTKSPFTGLRSANLELKNLFSNGWKIFSVCAVTLIPLIYAGLFLLAFLDPYGSLSQVPAAVVNLDKGAIVSDEQRYVGQELCDSLIQNNENAKEGEASGFDWKFVSSVKEAYQGLEDGTYYMVLIIPENFSENIASASTANPQKAELQAYFNPSTNLIAQTVGSSMVTAIKAQLNTKIQEEYYDTIFLSLSSSVTDLKTAANGSADLTDGLNQLQDGSDTLTTGLNTAASGASSLSSGATQIAEGVDQLADGLKQMKDGLDSSSDSTAALTAAMKDVAYWLTLFGEETAKENPSSDLEQQYMDNAAAAAQRVQAANSTLGDPLVAYICGGTFTYNSGEGAVTTTEKGLIPAFKEYAEATKALEEFEGTELQPLIEDVQAIKEAIGNMSDNVGPAYEALQAYENSVEAYGVALQSYRVAVAAYTAALVEYEAGAITWDELQEYQAAVDDANATLTTAETQLTQARSTVVAYLTSFIEDTATIYGSAADVLYRLQSIDHVEELVTQLIALIKAQATTGAAAQGAAGKAEGYLVGVAVTSAYASSATEPLSSGINQMYTAVALGSSTSVSMQNGMGQLAEGANQLQSGLVTAADGSYTITYNLGTAASGSQTLTDGLTEGVASAEDQTANADEKVQMMSNPVTANGDSAKGENITTVRNYGTGFAPYFIGLGMWVGILMITFLMRTLNDRILMTRSWTFSAVLSSYLAMLAIAFAQVLILLAVIHLDLGMNVNFVPQYYLFGLLVAAAFVAIIQFCRIAFGTAGLVVVVVLLMLQLCTAAGTFPIEAELQIFNILNPILPMTYVVRGFRMAMCGLSAGYMIQPAIVLAGFTVLFLVLSTAVAQTRRRVSMVTLYPKIQIAD